jgi:hypothetical protein
MGTSPLINITAKNEALSCAKGIGDKPNKHLAQQSCCELALDKPITAARK